MTAVSMKFTPSSAARRIHAADLSLSSRGDPKVLPPRPVTDTFRSDPPIFRYFIATPFRPPPLYPLEIKSMGQEIENQTIELVCMFPLRPVTAFAENMEFPIRQASNKLEAVVKRHEAVIPTPGYKSSRFDFAKAGAQIGSQAIG